ncbi:MAG: hypothetical protein K9H49_02150 [Bacteroidales bacterium]|nr:hypothetical protein [Bacteroidales bacterium]MCF8403371.1 hypothetical protein [Bacteroidales bacterium]
MKKINLKISILTISFIAIIMFFTSCTKDNQDTPPPTTPIGYTKGVFIINEGPFQSGTGTVTYINRDATEKTDKLFQQSNNLLPLGNIVQSMNVYPIGGEDAFITVNNANKIEVVKLRTFQQVRTIENITSPRYVEFSKTYGKMYVSSWDNTVKIFSLEGYESLGQANVGTGPEKMLELNDKIWVLNQGGFSIDSTISVIDAASQQVVETIQVYAKPTGIVKDESDNVWVICSGKGWNGFPGADDSKGHLVCINPENYSFIKDLEFPTSSEHPEKLVINTERDMLYYNYPDGIYRFDIHDNELPTEAFIPRPNMFYGLGLDQAVNTIYASDPLDYTQNGKVYRYSGYTGEVIDSLDAGVVPGEFYFTPMLIIQ